MPNEFRQFDHASISSVVLHINYAAREAGGVSREAANQHLHDASKLHWPKETSMPQALDPATIGLAKLLDPVAECFTPEVAKRVAELGTNPAVQVRLDELAEKCHERTITPEETAAYDAYMRAMDVIAVLRKKARSLLVQSPTS